MKKLYLLLTLFAVALGFSAGAVELTSYAPNDTNVIVYANARKISQSRIYRAMLQQYPQIKASLDNFDAEVKKETGLALPQLLNSETCLFVNVRNFENDPQFDLLFCADAPVAKTVFDKSEKEGKDTLFSLQGKRAIKTDEYCLVEMTPYMASLSSQTRVLTQGQNKLSPGIDKSALISATLDFSCVNIPIDEENPLTKIAQHLQLVSFNCRETAIGVRLEIVSRFDNQEAAKDAEAFARLMKKMLIEQAQKMQTAENQAIINAVSGIQIEQSQNKVTLYGDLTDQEFLTFIGMMSN